MIIKICSKCKQEKPPDEFSRKTGNKYHPLCKSCQAFYYRHWYTEYGRNRASDYAQIILLWKKNHRKEINISARVRHAVETGELSKPLFCCICGRRGRINGHHDDYDKPFDVLWVCSSCHKKIHLNHTA